MYSRATTSAIALRPVFPADFLPADLVVGAISVQTLLAHVLGEPPGFLILPQCAVAAIAILQECKNEARELVRTDRDGLAAGLVDVENAR